MPQGSVLGPLLFIISINDLNLVSDKLQTIQFADDTSLNGALSSFNASMSAPCSVNINTELNLINEWLMVNKLSLNISKTKYMIFRLPNSPVARTPILEIKINNTLIEKVTKFDFLGLVISETLSWKEHANKISAKIAQTVGMLSRMKRYLDTTILRKIYNSLILSYLHYGILCWGFESHRLLKLQKRAVRLLCNAKYNAHTEPLFKSLRLLKVGDIFNVQCIKFFYKSEHGLLPNYFEHFYVRKNAIHPHNTRQQHTIHAFRYRFTHTGKTIRHTIPQLINNLPETLKNRISTHSLDSVKTAIKDYYINSYDFDCKIINCYVCRRS